MSALWHELLDPVPSLKMSARKSGLVEGACVCGYRSAPGDEGAARRAAEDHYEAVMTDEWLWVLRCPYCAVKTVRDSRSSAFLMWFGHWADMVKRGDVAHPNPPEPPGDDHYEGLRLSREHVRLMRGDA